MAWPELESTARAELESIAFAELESIACAELESIAALVTTGKAVATSDAPKMQDTLALFAMRIFSLLF